MHLKQNNTQIKEEEKDRLMDVCTKSWIDRWTKRVDVVCLSGYIGRGSPVSEPQKSGAVQLQLQSIGREKKEVEEEEDT